MDLGTVTVGAFHDEQVKEVLNLPEDACMHVPGAVLIRAAEIIDGLELARKNRKTRLDVELSNGPGKLTKALAISKIYNGLDLTKRNELFIDRPTTIENFETTTSSRIGVKFGAEKPWRFHIKNNKFVSKP